MNLFIYSFIYLCKYKAISLLIIYWNSNVFTKIIISTECDGKNKKFFFELVLRMIWQKVWQNQVYKANPHQH